MSATLPAFERTDASPELPPGFEGIVLQFPEEVVLRPPVQLPISGAFQMKADAVPALPRQDPFAALVVLVIETSTHRSVTFRPARSAVRLEPVAVPGGWIRGYFHVDAFAMTHRAPELGRYFVSAWLGDLRSDSRPLDVVKNPTFRER